MLNLLKADLLRIVKDKLFMIILIIAGALGVLMPLFYFGIFMLLFEDKSMIRESMSSANLALSAFSPFSNFGLVLAIFTCIIITKDFSNGTVRNKIIMGKSRTQVFMSNLLSTVICTVGVMLVFALVNFLVGSIFFSNGINKDTVGNLLLTLLFQILGWIVLASAMNFWANIMKNAGLAIVLYVILGLVLTFAASILTSIETGLSYSPDTYATAIKVMDTINALNFVGSMSTTLAGSYSVLMGTASASSGFSTAFILEYLGSVVACGAFFTGIGYVLFKKKDLK